MGGGESCPIGLSRNLALSNGSIAEVQAAAREMATGVPNATVVGMSGAERVPVIRIAIRAARVTVIGAVTVRSANTAKVNIAVAVNVTTAVR